MLRLLNTFFFFRLLFPAIHRAFQVQMSLRIIHHNTLIPSFSSSKQLCCLGGLQTIMSGETYVRRRHQARVRTPSPGKASMIWINWFAMNSLRIYPKCIKTILGALLIPIYTWFISSHKRKLIPLHSTRLLIFTLAEPRLPYIIHTSTLPILTMCPLYGVLRLQELS